MVRSFKWRITRFALHSRFCCLPIIASKFGKEVEAISSNRAYCLDCLFRFFVGNKYCILLKAVP